MKIIWAIVIIIIVVGGWFFFNNEEVEAPTDDINTEESTDESGDKDADTGGDEDADTGGDEDTDGGSDEDTDGGSDEDTDGGSDEDVDPDDSVGDEGSEEEASIPVEHVIEVRGSNFQFDVTEIKVAQGDTVTINFETAEGFHDWTIDEFSAATNQVSAGTPTSVTFVADTTGTFEYYCSVGNHRAQGMVGTLIVE